VNFVDEKSSKTNNSGTSKRILEELAAFLIRAKSLWPLATPAGIDVRPTLTMTWFFDYHIGFSVGRLMHVAVDIVKERTKFAKTTD